jgi:hypothetical protein
MSKWAQPAKNKRVGLEFLARPLMQPARPSLPARRATKVAGRASDTFFLLKVEGESAFIKKIDKVKQKMPIPNKKT